LNLVSAQVHPDPGNMGPLHEWLPEALWPKIKALEGLKQFSGLGDAMHSDSDDWLAWFDGATQRLNLNFGTTAVSRSRDRRRHAGSRQVPGRLAEEPRGV
jgi:hypothetical protein